MKDTKPKLKLIGADGNAFNLLGLARRDAKRAGWPQAKIDEFFQEATSGDYDHLLQTCMKYFDVESADSKATGGPTTALFDRGC